MANVFGEHRPKIPYQPVADLLAQYRQRDPDKLAIVDLDQGTSISFGGLDRAVTDIAAALKGAGVGKGSRVLLLSDETLEKLLIWLAVWRLGAVVAPLNIELNATLIADLATAVSPVLTLVHKELDGATLLAGKSFVRFGAYTAAVADADPQDDFFRAMWRRRACRSATMPPTLLASSVRRGPPTGPRSWCTTIAPIGSTGCLRWNVSG
jgi:acyl-CoA synthetase (AMP-forming)/AMP-acid ligase II